MTLMRSAIGDRKAALLVLPLTALLALVLVVFYGAYDTARVDGPSMDPTLLSEDRLLVTKGYPDPRRGDIIVFEEIEGGTPMRLVKRVVGIPGDSVRTVGDRAWVNEKPEAAHEAVIGPDRQIVEPSVVAPGELFVMGDNRPDSTDSRFFGPIALRSVIGRAVAVFSPVTRIRHLDRIP
ncbi:MAG: signal peptidase I [Coriobacteriia bacterium]